MYELVYYSEADESLTIQDIEAILKTARGFNRSQNITGCLIYHNGEFIQILEGEEKAVKALYAKISKDPRHHNVTILMDGKTDKRVFQDWSMAYYRMDNNKLQEIGEQLFVDNLKSFADFAEKPTDVVELFWYTSKQILS
jgi:hypothetical protein